MTLSDNVADRPMVSPPTRRPEVVVTDRYMHEVSDECVYRLIDINNPPFIFVRGRSLVRVGTDKKGRPVIEKLQPVHLAGILDRYVRFTRMVRHRSNGQEYNDPAPTKPPADAIMDILSQGSWDFPGLTCVVQTPIIHLDGSVVIHEGYDPETEAYYVPPIGTTIPPIPERPTREDVERSVRLINEPFVDFPLIDDGGASKTHIIAALFTSILRPVIPGIVPAFLIDKPSPGTGASLIASIISEITQGNKASMLPAPKNDEEWKKTITSILIQGTTLVNIDNVEHKLYAPAFAALITAPTWTDRVLGVSEMVTIDNRTTWILNGNNITLGGDLPRRVIWARMDAKSRRPWQRDEPFTHPDVLAYTHEHRGEILAAVLTLARYWIQQGKPGVPDTVPKLGGYEHWRNIVGGVLTTAGYRGFLGNLDELYTEMDVDGTQWDTFIEAWHGKWGEKGLTTADILDRLHREQDSTTTEFSDSQKVSDCLPDDISDALSDRKGSVSRRVGNALRKRKDRVFAGNLRLMPAGVSHKVALWCIKPLTIEKSPTSEDRGGSDKTPSDVEGGLRGFHPFQEPKESDTISHIREGLESDPLKPPVRRDGENANPPNPMQHGNGDHP